MRIDIKIDTSKLAKKLKDIVGYSREVRAGVLGDEDMATIARANEYGAWAGWHRETYIPPRPFLRRAKTINQRKWQAIFKDGIKSGFNVDNALKAVGSEMQADIVKSIGSNIPPENADATVEKKGSDQTLVDTGALSSAIGYKVQ